MVRLRGRVPARRVRLSLIALAMGLAILATEPAHAHTEFDRSVPDRGEAVTGPLRELSIIYTNEATEAGEGFVVLDPGRGEIRPDRVLNPRVGVFRLQFDQELTPGEVGVRWTVRAPDAHPINGAYSFSLLPAGDGAAAEPDGDGPGGSAAGGTGPDLQEFLEADTGSTAGDVVARAGRAITFLGLVAALGLAVFADAVMRGSRAELRTLVGWIRLGGLLIVGGTLIDAAGQVMVTGGGLGGLFQADAWRDTWTANLGTAWLIRLGGGGLIAYGARGRIADPPGPARDHLHRMAKAIPRTSAAPAATHPGAGAAEHGAHLRLERRTVPLAIGLALMLLAAHSYDGHTATEGNRILTGAAAAVHVLAGSVWASGIIASAWLIYRRHRRSEPSGGLQLAARFSVVAGASLALVGLAGGYLTYVILDTPSELWTTDWGKLLIAKLAVVGIAAAIGAYNHFRLIPAIESSGEHPLEVARLRTSLRGEAILMFFVVALSAVLVRASSVAG